MEVDTGAAVSVISEDTYVKLWPEQRPQLQPSTTRLKTFMGEVVKVLGTICIPVAYDGQQHQLDLLVIPGSGPSLFGRNWLQHITLDWAQLHHVHLVEKWQDVVDWHADHFKEELGFMKDAEAKLIIDTKVQPKFYRPRPVPYALKERVGQELDRLKRTGVIEKIPNLEWAAPIVPVVKPDGSIRICGDYKLTANKAAKTESYPLPKVEDIFSSLSGGKLFTTLDLAHAYNQIPLDLESQKLVVLNTHKGLYRYKRLPFGIASAPAVFQRMMENLLRDIPCISVYLDDILVTGKSLEDHIKNLEEVLIRLERAGVRLKKQSANSCVQVWSIRVMLFLKKDCNRPKRISRQFAVRQSRRMFHSLSLFWD